MSLLCCGSPSPPVRYTVLDPSAQLLQANGSAQFAQGLHFSQGPRTVMPQELQGRAPMPIEGMRSRPLMGYRCPLLCGGCAFIVLVLVIVTLCLNPSFTYSNDCYADIYYGYEGRPTIKFGDLPSLIRHSSLINILPMGSPVADTPVKQMLKTGVIPPGWEAQAKARGIQKVGVIGAGPSGLVTAKVLSEAGFEVVVLEADSKVGGQSYTYKSEQGLAHDLATKYIPVFSSTGSGTTPLHRAIIDSVKKEGVTVRRSGGTTMYDNIHDEPMKLPPILQQCSRMKMASDLIIGVNIFEQLAMCPGVGGVVDCGIAGPNESLEDWSNRMQLECLGHYVALAQDSIGAGPALQQHVGYSLKSSSYFLLVDMLHAILDQGVLDLPEKLLPPKGPLLQALATNLAMQDEIRGTSFSDTFTQGYDGFWNMFVKTYSLDVRLSESVTQVTPGAQVSVRTTKGTYSFDHVVVAAPPRSCQQFLPATYAAVWDGVKVSNTETCAWPTISQHNFMANLSTPNAVLYPKTCEAKLGMPGGIYYDTARMISINYEYDDGIYVTLAYPKREDWRDGTNCRLVGEQLILKSWRLPIPGDVVARQWAQWPSYVDGALFGPYFEAVRELQGRDGLSFVGENLAGNNVPAIVEWTTAFIVSGDWLGKAGQKAFEVP